MYMLCLFTLLLCWHSEVKKIYLYFIQMHIAIFYYAKPVNIVFRYVLSHITLYRTV